MENITLLKAVKSLFLMIMYSAILLFIVFIGSCVKF